MSTGKRAVSVLFNNDEYATLVRESAELTLAEGRRVSVAELVRRATFAQYINRLSTASKDAAAEN